MIPENFATHAVFEKLQQLRQILDEANSKEKIPVADLAFFDAAYKYIADRLKLTLPLLVQEAELNALSSEVDAATSQVNSFLGNNNSGHITNAINHFYTAFNRIKKLPYPLSKGDFDFSRSIASFQQSVKAGYKKIESINAKVLEDLAVAQADLEARQTQLDAFEQKINTKEIELQNVLSRYNTEIENLKSTIATEVESDRRKINASFDDERKRLSNEFETDIKLYKEQFDMELEAHQKNYEGQLAKLEYETSSIIQSLHNKLAEANKIVNIVGNVGVTGNYQNIANENRKAANQFRLISLVFMMIMSGLLIWSIIELSRNGEFNLNKSLVRILAAAVLTYPAVYAARESTRHRKLETQNRNIELELASIGPFIELLPEEKKEKIKEELVTKYFGNQIASSITKEGEEDVSVNALERIMKAMLPLLKK